MASPVDRLDTYVPTPLKDVARMLRHLRRGDVFCDLGSGDGRLLVGAMLVTHRAVGYELNPEMAEKSRATLPYGAEIREEDFMQADWSEFDYLTYQGEWSDQIREKFRAEARPGARLMIYRKGIFVQP